MSDSRFPIIVKVAAVIAVVCVFFYWDARPMLNWFDDMKAGAGKRGYVVVPGTELKGYLALHNPVPWFGGYTGASSLIQEQYVGKDDGTAAPIGVRMCFITEQDREIHEFWLLFSSDRSCSEAFPIPPLDGSDSNSQLRGLLKEGDAIFTKGKRDRLHDAVLKILKPH